jgi:CHAT domain-containing protein
LVTEKAWLWPVSDRSTADIMTKFYGQLARGVSKDEALGQAQRHLLRSAGPASHPFYWAAFQLSGDWR